MSETTSRIPYEDDPAPPGSDVYDSMRARGRPILNLYRVIANSPEVLKGFIAISTSIRDASERGLRELGISYLARRRRCDYVNRHHTPHAIANGLDESLAGAFGADGWDRSAAFSEVQQAVLTTVDEIVDAGAASAESVAGLRQLLGDRGTVELLVALSFYEAACVLNLSLGVPVEPGTPEW